MTYLASLFVLLIALRPLVPAAVPRIVLAAFAAVAVGLETWHVVEHSVIISNVTQNGGCPCPGIVDAATGLTDTVLHFGYNSVAYIGTLVPFWYVLRAWRQLAVGEASRRAEAA